MNTWRIAKTGLALALLTWGCGMAEMKLFQPKPLDGMKEVPASQDTPKLDGDVAAFLRDKYSIVSARYFRVPAEIPWIAVSKSVQNQMAEKSIEPKRFDWYEPGIDFVDVYPQGNDAFAVAMPKGARSSDEKLVGFYVLKGGSGAK